MADAFSVWVANAIYDISGIWPEEICASPRKRTLTRAENRMVARQGVCEEYFDPVDLGDMRLSARAITNFTLAGRKPH